MNKKLHKYINTNEHVKKDVDWFVNFNFQKPPMRCTKVLLPLNENKRTQNLSQIAIQIVEKLVNMS